MDAPEDDLDIKLQKISGDLITDFDRSLPPFLRKSDGAGGSRIRSKATWRETGRLISSLLDPFQEVPQLLDPHLPKWLPLLANTLLEYFQARPQQSRVAPSARSFVMPMSTAICKLIYTFCKIRGEKVIVGFLNVETKYLELLLSHLEEAELRRRTTPSEQGAWANWTWEERYVVLLWLSQLFLAPFDLSTISSKDIDDEDLPAIPGLVWPADVPGITARVLPLAISYLSSPGKERDAAKALLVRIAMRKDMQELGILHALVHWALYSISPRKGGGEEQEIKSPYHYIGILSFLAGILISSSDASDLDRYLSPIFRAVHGIATDDDDDDDDDNEPLSKTIVASALARKMMIKVVRSIAVQVLRKPSREGMAGGTELVETTIGYLLERLGDNDTPVRLAASKALSVVTLKLDPDMASQVVDAVLESLNRNVLWIKNPPSSDPKAPRARDLTSVDPLEWHGLMLTLSHLLYRRSPPAENLSDIIHALLLGLSFDRRSAAGGSTGANVRDAACFGIWALARRYTTKEILSMPARSVSAATAAAVPGGGVSLSILQIIATELVVTACLDPSGNIRRGSSAALQELIGRHPDTVDKGIWVVQAVDYHAVALRSRAVSDVAMKATKLSSIYGEAILEALLGWRGIGDADASARRAAASAFGAITAQVATSNDGGSDALARLDATLAMVFQRFGSLQKRQVEDRHGVLLSLAAVLDAFPALVSVGDNDNDDDDDDDDDGGAAPPAGSVKAVLSRVLDGLRAILQECEITEFRRPELIAEAASRLIVSSFPVLQVSLLGPSHRAALVSGPQLLANVHTEAFTAIVASVDAKRAHDHDDDDSLLLLLSLFQRNITTWLNRPEDEVTSAASAAALIQLVFSGARDREATISSWAQTARHPPSARTGAGFGFFTALTTAHPFLVVVGPGEAAAAAATTTTVISSALLDRWATDKRVETRVALLQALTASEVLERNAPLFLPLLAVGLDDYTTTARGDIGSHVRSQALRAIKSLWASSQRRGGGGSVGVDLEEVAARLFLPVLRLAAEKLDRVRAEAHLALAMCLQPTAAAQFRQSTFSSRTYFRYLLGLLSTTDQVHPAVAATAQRRAEDWMDALLLGLVTSADTGNEDLVVASRAALSEHCALSADNLDAVCAALVRNLGSSSSSSSSSSNNNNNNNSQPPGGGGQDRAVVATLEVVAYLFYAGLFPRCRAVNYRSLCLLVQKAGYKTGNVRKLEACVRVYGAVAGMRSGRNGREKEEEEERRRGSREDEGIREARRRLGALMSHPWPRIRSLVVDELWGLLCAGGEADAAERLKSVDWGTASKAAVKALVEDDDLGLVKRE